MPTRYEYDPTLPLKIEPFVLNTNMQTFLTLRARVVVLVSVRGVSLLRLQSRFGDNLLGNWNLSGLSTQDGTAVLGGLSGYCPCILSVLTLDYITGSCCFMAALVVVSSCLLLAIRK